LKPNDLGLFDMHGNVWQWTQDAYNHKPTDEEDDRGESVPGASKRVYRGGCWFNVAGYCRAAFRDWYSPVDRVYFLGFRLARVPVEGK
jgi:formylglycine-generating enzyme required for sulfatase activity